MPQHDTWTSVAHHDRPVWTARQQRCVITARVGSPVARRRSALRRAIVLTVATTLASACHRKEPEPAIEGTVSIGVGAIPGRPGFESMVRGLQMAVERLNETGKAKFKLRLPERSSTSAVQTGRS